QHERRFGIIEFGCDGLHLHGRETAGIQHDRKRIAAEGTVGKNIDGDIAPLHLRSPISENQPEHDAARFVKRVRGRHIQHHLSHWERSDRLGDPPILPQSSVRRKRVTAMVMASSISAISAIVSYCRFSSVAPFSMMARTIRT